MQELRTHLDFETRSTADLRLVGEHAYAQHWTTAPLMLTYGTAPRGIIPNFDLIDFFDIDGYAQSIYPISIAPEYEDFKVPCPQPIYDAVMRGDTFVAHNARFEQVIYYYICHLRWGWPLPKKWSCTAARARYNGLRASLDGVGSDLELHVQKDTRGKDFINNFCKPRKYKGRKIDNVIKDLWYEPWENPEGWAIGKQYCITDGIAEAEVDAILPDLPEFEQAAWEWDFDINTRGVPLDIPSVKNAIEFSDHFTNQAVREFERITDLRPTQRDRVLEYLQQREEVENLGDLRSKTLKRLVIADFPEDLQRVIKIRLDCSLASIKKLETMVRCTDTDGRARGIHLYGGAHTMRWSAKRVQTQNMKRGNAKIQKRVFEFLEAPCWDEPKPLTGPKGRPLISLLDEAREVKAPSWQLEANLRFFSPLGDLSQSMRGFIKAPEGYRIISADYAQIEARVLVWLARSERKLQAFRDKMDMYCLFASTMYNIPYDDFFEYRDGVRSVKEKYKFMRQIAKSAVLGCGFGLGGGKFQEYCDNSDIIITQDEAKETVDAWRGDNPEVVKLWYRVEQAAIHAVLNEGEKVRIGGTGVIFYVERYDSERYWLRCELPSGRCISYYRPKVESRIVWGKAKDVLSFRTEWVGKSYRESTYGGKLVENMVQAIARDIMVQGGLTAEQAGYKAIMLVHDEIATLVKMGFGSAAELCRLLCTQREWVTDLPIEAEGAEMERYGK